MFGALFHFSENPSVWDIASVQCEPICWGTLLQFSENQLICWGTLLQFNENPSGICWDSVSVQCEPICLGHRFSSVWTHPFWDIASAQCEPVCWRASLQLSKLYAPRPQKNISLDRTMYSWTKRVFFLNLSIGFCTTINCVTRETNFSITISCGGTKETYDWKDLGDAVLLVQFSEYLFALFNETY